MELTRTCPPFPLPIEYTTSGEFVFRRGTTFRATFGFKLPTEDSSIPIEDSNPQPLTNTVVTFHLLEKGKTVEALILSSGDAPHSSGSSVTISDSPNGKAVVLITDEYTASIPKTFKAAYWWITLSPSNGDIDFRGKGTVVVKEPYE